MGKRSHPQRICSLAGTMLPLAAALTALLVPEPAAAGQGGRGFMEARASAFTGAEGEKWQTTQRLRPTLDMSIGERARLVMTVEAGLSQGRDDGCELQRSIEESELGRRLEEEGCVPPDRGHEILRVHDAGDYLDVDRLFVDVYRSSFDLRVGRQSIHWGSAQFFNPTDPFPEVLLEEPWRPRRGLNALRASVPLGAMNELTAVAAVDDSLRHGRLAARARVHVAGFDAALVGSWLGDSRDAMLGVDLRGTNVVGWWLEAAAFPGEGAHTELSVGFDYSFPVLDRMVLMGQYYRNGRGAAHPDDYQRGLAVPKEQLLACGGAPLFSQSQERGTTGTDGSFAEPGRQAVGTLGRDYLLLGAMVAFNPEISFDGFLLKNLNDGTAMAAPTISYIATGSVEISLSARVPFSLFGDGGELRPRPEDTRIEHELPEGDPVTVDLSGLVPSSTLTLWTRVSF